MSNDGIVWLLLWREALVRQLYDYRLYGADVVVAFTQAYPDAGIDFYGNTDTD